MKTSGRTNLIVYETDGLKKAGVEVWEVEEKWIM